MKRSFGNQVSRLGVASLVAVTFAAQADVVTDWNIKAGEVVTESKMGTPPAIRAMAIVQTAVHQAVSASTPSTSINAAVAAANRVTLTKLMPAQQALIDAAYQAALQSVVDGPAKTAGIAVGEQAAVRATGLALAPQRAQQLAELGQIDVLLVPIDGVYTMSQAEMVEVIEQVPAIGVAIAARRVAVIAAVAAGATAVVTAWSTALDRSGSWSHAGPRT